MGRPNNLSLVCLYLSLYISFLSFGHFYYFWHNFFFFKNVQIIKRKYQKKKCPNIKKEIYNDKYRHTRYRLFGLPQIIRYTSWADLTVLDIKIVIMKTPHVHKN